MRFLIKKKKKEKKAIYNDFEEEIYCSSDRRIPLIPRGLVRNPTNSRIRDNTEENRWDEKELTHLAVE